MNTRIISVSQITAPTRYERAKTRKCYDLRWYGPNSEVRIINPARKPKRLTEVT